MRAFGFNEGLEDTSVNAITQDEDGFIWAGTDSGLFRFDGRRFERQELKQTYEYVTTLLSAPGSRLWVGTRNGLGVLDLRRGTFTTLPLLEGQRLNALCLDSEGGVYALSGNRLFHARDGQTFQPRSDLPEPGNIHSVFADPRSETVVVTGSRCLWTLRRGEGVWGKEALPLSGKEEPLLSCQDGQGQLWARTSLALYRKGPGATAWTRLGDHLGGSPPNNLRLSLDREGWVWVNTTKGIFRCQGKHCLELLGAPKGFTPTSGMVDRDGSPWITAIGVLQVLGSGRWEHHTIQEGLPNSLVWHFLRDAAGRMWMATNGGLVVESPRGWQLVRAGQFSRLRLAPDKAILAVGSPGGTLYRVDPRSFQVEEIRVDCLPASSEARGLAVEPDGRVWVSDFRDGFAMGEKVGGRWRWERAKVEGRYPEGIWQVVQDASGTLFLATREGLFIRQQGRWVSVGPTLPFNPFSALRTPQGDVWVFYFDRSFLTRHRQEGGVWKTVEEWHPFPSRQRTPLLGNALAPDGRIWVGTNQGLGLLDPSRHSVDAWYGSGDGIPGADASNHGLLLEPNGDLWYGTTEGAGLFRAAGSRVLAPMPLPILVQWNGAKVIGPGRDPEFDLKPGEVIEAHFALNAFDSPLGTFLEARMEGVDKDWVPLMEHRLRYAGLPPAHYRLEVRGNRLSGAPGPSLILAVHVLPRWWQSWWAVLLGLVGLSLAAATVVSLRHRALLRHNLELQREVAARTADLNRSNIQLDRASRAKSLFLATMSHELRTPLNAILLYTELMAEDAEARKDEEGKRDIQKVQMAGQHLLATINGILDLSRIEAGVENLDLSEQDVGVLLLEVVESLRPLAEQKGNRIDLVLPEEPRFFRTDPTKLKQVLLNIGGNACKFTCDGHITITAALGQEGIRIQIRDTGRGMTADELEHIFRAFEQANETIGKHYGGTGLGLTISRRLVELLGGSIQVSSAPDEGSTFTVILPRLIPEPT